MYAALSIDFEPPQMEPLESYRMSLRNFSWRRSFVSIAEGWTRETMNATVDNFLKEVHVAIEQNPQMLAPQLSRYQGLI
jgi:hypothetical protein